jgi:hypothetical protein
VALRRGTAVTLSSNLLLWEARHVGLDNAAIAFVDEAMKKTGLIWLKPAGGRQQAVWHVWLDGAAYVLTGPGEQPNPGLFDGRSAEVTARSKDNGHLLVVFEAEVSICRVEEAPQVAEELAKGRLNLRDAENAPARWAADSSYVIFRLEPALLLAVPGTFSAESRRAAPVESPATTQGRRPTVFHRRGHSGRPLS